MVSCHTSLILKLLQHIEETCNRKETFIFVDDPSLTYSRPQRIGNSVPDVHAKNLKDGFEVVGEAKPTYDLTSARTCHQLNNFLEYLTRNKSAQFVLSTEESGKDIARKIIFPIRKKLSISEDRIIIL